MAKKPEFYRRYVMALFQRGREERLPMQYLMQEAERVLNPDEMKTFIAELEAMVQAGDIQREDDMLQLANKDS